MNRMRLSLTLRFWATLDVKVTIYLFKDGVIVKKILGREGKAKGFCRDWSHTLDFFDYFLDIQGLLYEATNCI